MIKVKKLFLLACCFIHFCSLNAQQITISGYITEKGSSERMIGAIVFIPEKNIGTSSNAFGFYSISLPSGDVNLRASFTGYEPYTSSVTLQKDTVINMELATATDLKEVVVTSQRDAIQTRTQMSSIDLPIQTIKSLPAFLGEVDIMKAIQLLPGVQSGNEGTSGIYVRGGGPDQNLILLDGVPVYNATHLFGFFSVFNADAVKSVEVIKGGFPARYGGRLSSVIDINMKEGNNNKLRGEGGIGLIASRLMLEGPIQKGKSSFMISGRRTYVDVIAKPFMKGNLKSGYFFYDLNGKMNFKLTNKDHLYISGYFGNDKFYAKHKQKDGIFGNTMEFDNSVKWGNITAVGRWNHEFGPKVFGNLTTYYSQYKFLISSRSKTNFSGSDEDFLLRYNSGINDIALKYDVDIIPSPNHSIKTGAGIIAHTYTPGAQQIKIKSETENIDNKEGQKNIQANEVDAYIEDDVRISSKLKANIGLHATAFTVHNNTFLSLQPRIAMRYLLSEAMSLKASYVQMNQFIHLLTNSSLGLPTDLWVPVTKKIPPQKSNQYAAGIAYSHPSGVELTVEGYYKTMQNVIEYKEGASFFNSSTNWEDKVEIGEGRSYGAEFFLQKKKGDFTGLAGYTLSWTNRRFDNLNDGKIFPYRYDRRHDIKLALIYAVSKNIEASCEWVYGSGNAITLPVGVYEAPDGNQVQIYSSRNGYRMASYHRGDVSIKFSKAKRRMERSWIVSAYNVYNRKNPFYLYSDNNEQGNTVFKQMSLFPIIPSISYQFKF